MRFGRRLCRKFPCLIDPGRETGCITCPEDRSLAPLFTSLYSLSPFTPRTRSIIHEMKYLKNSSVARCLGWQLALFLTVAAPRLITRNSVILPIPITLGKLIRRGFNQSALMAKNLSRTTGIPCLPWGLRRVAEFSPQAGKTARERRVLTREVFRINTLIKKNHKNIILLDDTATTLATLNAAAKEVRKASGPGVAIYGLTAARSF